MSTTRRNFSKEEKLQIVLHSQEPGVRIEDIALEYKIHANSIYKWRREYLSQGDLAFPGNGNKSMTDEQRQISELKQQLKEAELEKEILKKALGIFSSPSRKNSLS
jgi:transposase